MVSVNAGAPGLAEFGLRLVTFGVGALIVTVSGLETAPPGLNTVTEAVPWLAIKLAAAAAVNCAALTYVVDSAIPFHSTADPLTNPEPLTVSVNAGPPAVTMLGLSVPIVGPVIVTPRVACAVCFGDELSVTVKTAL